MIEGWGTGIGLAQNLIKEAGLPPARFHLKGYFFQVSTVWRWKATLDEVEQKILTLATRCGVMTSVDAAKDISLTDRSVRRILVDLVKKGYLVKTGTTRDAAYRLK